MEAAHIPASATFQGNRRRMRTKFTLTNTALALCALAALTSGAVLAQVQSLSMLNRLQSGSWELRERGDAGPPRRLCLRNARRLIQLRHPGQNCSRIIVEDGPEQVTVQYTCAGRGYGRTQIRRESDSLLQIESQGIAEGLPFAFASEARRVGSCAAR
jgi:hypothetical protein